MAHVEVSPEVRLYVEDFGEGPPVVFVHGGGVTHSFWQHQVAGLLSDFRTVTFDLRGCGASDVPASGYSVDVWAEDLRVLIETMGLERPVVIGHALGSHVTLRLAATHPELLGKIVLASSAPWFLGERDQDGAGFSEEFWKGLKASMTGNRPQAELDLADAKYFHRDPGEGTRIWALGMALEWPIGVYFELFRTLPNVDHREALGGIGNPALVAHGRHDTKNRYDGGILLSEMLPRAELVTFEESAHCPPLEEVERFNEVIAAFARGESPSELTVAEAS